MSISEDVRSLWNYDDPAGSESKFDELLSDLGECVEPDFRAEVLSQKARARGLQRRFDDARATLSEARRLVLLEPTSGRVSCELEAGRVENSSGNTRIARDYFLKALELAKEGGHEYLAVDAAHMLAIVDNGGEALRWNEIAIAMANTARDPKARKWLGSLLNNSGWVYYDLGEFDRAMDLFVQALEFRESQDGAVPILIAHYCIGKTLRAQQRFGEALAKQLELEARYADIQSPSGFVFEEIAESLLALGRLAEAEPYFARAFELLKKDPWLMDLEPDRVERIGRLGGAETEQGGK